MNELLHGWEYEDTVERVLDVPPDRALAGVMGATFRDVPLASHDRLGVRGAALDADGRWSQAHGC
jgi:hypothetical protein